MNRAGKAVSVALAMGVTLVMTAFAGLGASEFEGVWAVKDSDGKPFEITLSADGTAKGSADRPMDGTWKEEANSAVISWSTGWTTKITKEGDLYVKTAYGKGQPLDGPPKNKSDAQKK